MALSQTLKRLKDGNLRFVSGKTALDVSEVRRTKVAYQHKPFAAVLSCADSRVPPEIIFDQGLGELFVIRTAGAVLDQAVLGSLEFGVAELRLPVLVVLGHSRCGAVKFAMEVAEGSRNADAETAFLAEALAPTVGDPPQNDKDRWNHIARRHIQTVVDRLKHAPFLETAIQSGQLEIVRGWYDLDSGVAELSPD